MVSLSKARLRRSTALARSRRYISLNPLRYDPTRTTTIQRTFEEQFFKRFSKFQRELIKLLVSDDALGLKRMTLNTFCPTGKGGGIDPTCSLKGKKGKKAAKKKVKVTKSRFVEITDLTGSQALSLLNYSNFSASSINAGLRKGEIKDRQIVDDIDAVMLKSKTPKALTVYRGVQETYSFKPQNSKVGDTVEFLSYGSTSSSQYIAHMAARQYDYDDKGVVYRINLPKGSNVIDMSRVARSDEGEYLLPRNSKFKVSKIDSGEIDNEYGHDIIHLEPLNPTINTSWKFDSTQEKIDNFEQWIISKLTETMEDKDIHSGLDWWQMYIDRAFRMGSNQGYTAVKGKSLSKDPRASDQALGAKNQAMSMIYGMPATKERLKILTGRTFKGMKGLTDMMKTQLTQELTDGLIQGLSPRAIADNLVKRIGINKNRAMTIARTETVRSYNEGNLATFKALGVKNIGVKVEILVSGKACPKCQKLKGKIFTLEKAEGLLPLHPQCRCAYTPYISDEPSPQKERQKSWIERSILSVTRKQPLIGNAKKGWSKAARIKSALVRKAKKKVTVKSLEETTAKKALRGYAYGGDYIEINYALRKGKTLSKQLRNKVKALDEAIAASPKSIKPMTVYRRAFIPDLPKEGIYTDKSFMSTSRDTSGAFIKGHKHWEIRIPVGTPMASIPGRGPAGYGNERELVLPRNGKYKVISNEFNSSGILELLPPNQKKSNKDSEFSVSKAGSEWKAKLSTVQKLAVDEYKSSWEFERINKTLRTGKGKVPASKKNLISQIDSTFTKTKVPIQTYRGIRDAREFKKLVKTKSFIDFGYSSTSAKRQIAEEFSDEIEIPGKYITKRVMLRVNISKGIKVAYPDSIVNKGEAEVLLPRGTRFKVTGQSEDSYRIYLDVTPEHPKNSK